MQTELAPCMTWHFIHSMHMSTLNYARLMSQQAAIQQKMTRKDCHVKSSGGGSRLFMRAEWQALGKWCMGKRLVPGAL